MVLLQTSFLMEEKPSEETRSLAPPVPFQLVHPSLDYQGNTFRGCDCHIELIFKSWKRDRHLATLPTKPQSLRGVIAMAGYSSCCSRLPSPPFQG
jgi:hypothetical protein